MFFLGFLRGHRVDRDWWWTQFTSIHPSISFRLSVAGSRGQQAQESVPDVPLLSNASQLLLGNPEAFPGQTRYVISLCLPLGLFPIGRAGGILIRSPEPPQLASTRSSLRMSELLTLSLRLSPAPLRRKLISGRLYLPPHSFGHFPKLMTVGEGQNVDGPERFCTMPTALLTLHRTACPSHATFDLPSWTRYRDTWISSLGTGTPSQPRGCDIAFPAEDHGFRLGGTDSRPDRFTRPSAGWSCSEGANKATSSAQARMQWWGP